MKKMPLILSLMVNILLIIAVFAVRLHYHKMIFRSLHNNAAAGVYFHEQILTELESENEYKIETVMAMLEKNIQDGKVAAEVWKSAANRIRIK